MVLDSVLSYLIYLYHIYTLNKCKYNDEYPIFMSFISSRSEQIYQMHSSLVYLEKVSKKTVLNSSFYY